MRSQEGERCKVKQFPHLLPVCQPRLMRSIGRQKKGVPLDTPSDLRAVSRLNWLLQCVNADAEVNMKRRAIHHQSWH